MNSFSGEGYLVKDPETFTLKGGQKIIKFRIGSQKNFSKDVNWFNCSINSAYPSVQDFAIKYLKKGSCVMIVGSVDLWKSNRGELQVTNVTIDVYQLKIIGGTKEGQNIAETSKASRSSGFSNESDFSSESNFSGEMDVW